MQFLARLVHAERGARVVEVSARERGEVLGRCLGEGATAELAEERARERLIQLLAGAGQPSGQTPAPDSATAAFRRGIAPINGTPAPPTARAQLPANEAGAAGPSGAAASAAPGPSPAAPPTPTAASSQAPPASTGPTATASPVPPAAPEPVISAAATEGNPEPAPDPEDWSAELAQIDLQLRRLGWQREQEGIYLERAFGHPSRSRITTYADLTAYLQALQAMAAGAQPDEVPVPLRRRDLLNQCDALLAQLAWDSGQGRQLLEQHFQRSSRQQLSDTQLLQFNMLLEETLMQLPAAPEAEPPDHPAATAG